MLHLAYLGEAKKIDHLDQLKKYLIVRKPVHGIPRGFIHVPELSPSLSLFEQAQLWKQNIFTKEELEKLPNQIASSKKEVWWSLYVDRFKKELVERSDMVLALRNLSKELSAGEDVWLFCYCKDVHYCHRGLIGEYGKTLGWMVDFRETTSLPLEKNTDGHQLDLLEIMDE